MQNCTLGPMEEKFAGIIWDNAPIPSGELVKLCGQELSWKKSTTYTMLRRLCQRGIFQNAGGVVTALLTREEFLARKSEAFVQDAFGGSLPLFLAAFTSRQRLSEQEIAQLEELIQKNRG